jgi:hypothetical protein
LFETIICYQLAFTMFAPADIPAMLPAIAPADAPAMNLAPVFAMIDVHPNWLVHPGLAHAAVCDSLYAQMLLTQPAFLEEVITNDATLGHAPLAEPLPPRPAMSADHISTLFSNLDNGVGLPALQNMFLNYGFAVIMDEWNNPIVYVGNDSTAFYNWLNNAQVVTSSGTFFEQWFQGMIF